MEQNIYFDLGEEIIRQLKELNILIERRFSEIQNEKQRENLLQSKQ